MDTKENTPTTTPSHTRISELAEKCIAADSMGMMLFSSLLKNPNLPPWLRRTCKSQVLQCRDGITLIKKFI